MSSLSNSLTLAMAGVEVTILCPESSWLELLKQRYQLFIGGGSSGITLHIQQCSHPQLECVLSDEISFVGQVASLRSLTYHGFINIRDCTAQICTRAGHPFEDIDYFLRVAYALLAFRAGGILFHGAGIIHQGKGYLFFGHSGVGKTTVARLSTGDRILNDDLVILMPPIALLAPESLPCLGEALTSRINPQAWSIHSTPFWNPTQVKPSQLSVDLAAMFHLVQDQRVYLEPLSRGQALAELVASVPVISTDARQGQNILDRIEKSTKASSNL